MIIHVKASELQRGDIVLTHGMRVRLDAEVQAIPDANTYGGVFHHCRGLVENVEAIDDAWLARMTREFMPWPNRHVPTGIHRWTIQSNDLVTWTVEREDI